MRKRFLPILLVVLHLLALSPLWSADTSSTASARKKTVTTRKKATTTKKKATTKKKTTTRKKPASKSTSKAKKSTSSRSAASKADQQALIQELSMLQEVWVRKVTLEYLGDKRSDSFLSEVLADFSKQLQRNFVSNIRGDYKVEFFANYAAKADEVTDKAYAMFKDNPALDGVLGAVLKQSEFPMDLAFYDLVKKVHQRRKFQVTNGAKELEKLQAYWQTVYGKMRENANKDRYDAVAAMYKGVGPKEFPIHWYDDAQHAVAFETEGANPTAPKAQGRRKWTVLVYVCADNDLERFGLQDINEMEEVGSSKDVNVVVQIDRLRGGKGDTIEDGNWVGTRRYYVTKDTNKAKVTSKMVMNLGEQNMGNKTTLAEFLKWGVKTYPADNVAVVIWNHGMGWSGIAHDQESDEYIRVQDVAWALREGQKELSKVNKKASKFAIVDFDACLMGTIEVAYEIADSTMFMVASEETEPGQGMPYADYLGPLIKNPDLSPREVTKRMVGTYVYSYAKGGSATSQVIQGSPVTKSAVDLSKIPALVKKFDELGRALLDNHEVYAKLLISEAGRFGGIRRYSDDTLVDLTDFAIQLAQMPDAPSDIRGLCIDIIKTIGYPVANDKLSAPVIITDEKPGVVIWGFNGWRMPPRELWPAGTRVFRSRMAMTPLRQLQGGGYYCKIGPFQPVVDEALEKRVFVDEINYQIIRKDGKALDKRNIKQSKEYLIVSKFPAHSPMVIEGHTQGMGDSRGLSIYYAPSYNFITGYKAMKFAKDTHWDEFLETTPKFVKEADVLLCGQMVQDPMTLPVIAQALKANNVKFQVLWDASVFGFNFKDILRQFAGKGAVITDSVSSNSLGQLSPSSDDLMDYLNNGGRLLIAAQSFEQSNIHRGLMKDYLKFTYVDDEKDFDELVCKSSKGDFNMVLNGDESSRTASDVTIMKVGHPGKLIVTMPDGRGAGLAVTDQGRSGKNYTAVYLGFRLEAVGDTEARNKLVGEILNRILPERHQMSLF
ncbi:MAG: hypothetical protein PWR01_2264 [Clostridiales bacterium]|jgi:hypothetical protein|nr:hypothetical protein [Clostridiales bacterium]MDN5281191.1 hypothetical protein [Candidatus Ozemobacter sp.]